MPMVNSVTSNCFLVIFDMILPILDNLLCFYVSGVCAFIDYKMDFDFSGMGVKHYIETLGGTTEDELSPKVNK